MYRNFIRAASAVAAAVFLGTLASIYGGLDARSTECVTDSECEGIEPVECD